YEAVRLFADRASAVSPGFVLTLGNYPAVAQLCGRLDGIPLAIELAAVRLRALTLEQIVERLEDSYRPLVGGSPAALPRQRTLRALIDWSFELCSAQEQTLWARLSVFPGGFDLPAAEQVCGADGIRPDDVLGGVAGLVEKSVVVAQAHRGRMRYRLLE